MGYGIYIIREGNKSYFIAEGTHKQVKAKIREQIGKSKGIRIFGACNITDNNKQYSLVSFGTKVIIHLWRIGKRI